jgi:hypothetical protein
VEKMAWEVALSLVATRTASTDQFVAGFSAFGVAATSARQQQRRLGGIRAGFGGELCRRLGSTQQEQQLGFCGAGSPIRTVGSARHHPGGSTRRSDGRWLKRVL